MRLGFSGPPLYRMLKTTLVPPINAVYRPTVEGEDNVPASSGAVLAANHLSFVDSVFVPAAVDRTVYYLGKLDYFHGLGRHFFENVGVIPIDRAGGSRSEASLRRGQQILEKGGLLGMYPEGTRSPDGRLYRGKTGPVRLALRAGVPVVPIGLIGTREVMPPGARRPRIATVRVRFGAPLRTDRIDGYDEDSDLARRLTDSLMYEIMVLSGQGYVDVYSSEVKSGQADVSDDGGDGYEAAG